MNPKCRPVSHGTCLATPMQGKLNAGGHHSHASIPLRALNLTLAPDVWCARIIEAWHILRVPLPICIVAPIACIPGLLGTRPRPLPLRAWPHLSFGERHGRWVRTQKGKDGKKHPVRGCGRGGRQVSQGERGVQSRIRRPPTRHPEPRRQDAQKVPSESLAECASCVDAGMP